MPSRFIDVLFPPSEKELLVLSVGEILQYLSPRVCELEYDVTTLLPYDIHAVRACVVENKFHADEKAAELLGNVLAACLNEELGEALRTLYAAGAQDVRAIAIGKRDGNTVRCGIRRRG